MPASPPDPTRAPQVRLAQARDAGLIAAIHIASWRRAYAHVASPEALAHIPPGDRAHLWQRAITAAGGRRRVLLVSPPGGAPRGFAAWSPTRDADGDPATTAELCALYVHPDAWGAGLGRVLMERGIALARADGFVRATLWVVSDNPRARRFYETAGWAPDGTSRREDLLGSPVDEVRYARDLEVARGS